MGSQLWLTYFCKWHGPRQLIISNYSSIVCMSDFVCVRFCLFPGTEAEIQYVGKSTPLSFWCKLFLSESPCIYRNRAFGTLEQDMMWRAQRQQGFRSRKNLSHPQCPSAVWARCSLQILVPKVRTKCGPQDPNLRTGPAEIPLSQYHDNLCGHSHMNSSGTEKIHNNSRSLPDVLWPPQQPRSSQGGPHYTPRSTSERVVDSVTIIAHCGGMWHYGIEQVLGMGMKESILGKDSCADWEFGSLGFGRDSLKSRARSFIYEVHGWTSQWRERLLPSLPVSNAICDPSLHELILAWASFPRWFFLPSFMMERDSKHPSSVTGTQKENGSMLHSCWGTWGVGVKSRVSFGEQWERQSAVKICLDRMNTCSGR